MTEPSNASAARTGDPTVCYLFLAHNKFDLLLRTVERLAGPGVGFVFHFDSKVASQTVEDVKRKLAPLSPHIAFAKRERSRWASFGQVLAIMRCIQSALTALPPFDRYLLASGQCYPLMSPAEVTSFFAQHPDTEFIEVNYLLDVANPDESWWSPHYCFRRYHVWLSDKRWRPIPLLKKSAPVIPLYQGSQWWALTHAALTFVRRAFESNHKLRRQLSTSVFVDEAYIPSLMMTSPFVSKIAKSNTTYADFSKTEQTGPHPTVLTVDDFPALIASGKILARKVDPSVDAKLLDMLDAHVDARATEHAAGLAGSTLSS